jgi:chromate transporter
LSDRIGVAIPRPGTAGEVFRAFLKLGLTSFGGPIAQLGYFREEMVVRRRWIDKAGYADLLALCQFLPGPASSQAGFALGLLPGGALGALAAFIAFTLPSALVLILFAAGVPLLEAPVGRGILHGLKLVAVALVAQAVWGMARNLCPDRSRASIAVAAVLTVTFATGAFSQIAAILLGGLVGLVLSRDQDPALASHLVFPISRPVGAAALALFFLLLVLLSLAATSLPFQGPALFDGFYRSSALVFGGGHVVLPLLEAEVVTPGCISADGFLAGYGAAQAVPGPLFTCAAYLGAAMELAPNGLAGALLCLIAIFLPGFLLLVGALPFWNALRTCPAARAAIRGANAAVVGPLGAAFYHPVWTSAVHGPEDFALAVLCFVLLTAAKAPPWLVVGLTVMGAVLLQIA